MDIGLKNLVNSQSWFRALLVLSAKGRPCSLRYVAQRADLSPRGGQLALEKLLQQKLVKKVRYGKRERYKLQLSAEDMELLTALIEHNRRARIREKAKKYSRKGPKIIAALVDFQRLQKAQA